MKDEEAAAIKTKLFRGVARGSCSQAVWNQSDPRKVAGSFCERSTWHR